MTTHTGHAVVEAVRDVIAPCGVERVKAAVQRAIDGRVAEVVAQRDKAAEDAAAQQRWRDMAEQFKRERDELALRLAPTQRDLVLLAKRVRELEARRVLLEAVREAAAVYEHWGLASNRAKLVEALEAAKS